LRQRFSLRRPLVEPGGKLIQLVWSIFHSWIGYERDARRESKPGKLHAPSVRLVAVAALDLADCEARQQFEMGIKHFMEEFNLHWSFSAVALPFNRQRPIHRAIQLIRRAVQKPRI
jgi:hypothetical protein